MLVEDVLPSLKRAVGSCGEEELFRLLNLAIELLAGKKLVDPLQGTLDFYADGGYYFALPRDVKTPIKINVNNNPAFARSRIFEFSQNTDGTVDGPEVGWSWHDKGYSPIQDERKLPGRLKYATTSEGDNGKTIKIIGRDEEGREITETLAGHDEDPQLTTKTFFAIDRIVRQATEAETYLQTEGEDNLARYYPDERVPEYRVIKLSQKAVSCRMLYRKHVFKITSTEDVIPMRSQLALIQAVRGVVLMEAEENAAAEACFAKAEEFLGDEQATREENNTATNGFEAQTATNTNVSTRDCVIAGDVYDTACEIFGPIGRDKVFDRMTDAIEALANKGEWDAFRGAVDLWTSDRSKAINASGGKGDGYFVLPRRVESILALNYDGQPTIPRNRWSEFHLNGTGERYAAPVGHWEDAGEVVILNPLPIDPATRKVIPHQLIAVPDSGADNDTEIIVHGIERLADGTERNVMRNGKRGFTVPCSNESESPGVNAPKFVSISRIQKAESTGFIKLFAILEEGDTNPILLGYYEPDETAPNYRMIKVARSESERIRVLYRKRALRVSSMYEPLHLKSRLAIINAMRALKAEETDPAAASLYMGQAVTYLKDQEWSLHPTDGMSLQINDAAWPGGFENVT
jgi:hypothetical protein